MIGHKRIANHSSTIQNGLLRNLKYICLDRSVYVAKKNYKTSLHEYMETKEDHNVFNHTLEEILNNEWFTKTLPESWNDEDKCHRLCKKFCSVKSDHRVGLKNE